MSLNAFGYDEVLDCGVIIKTTPLSLPSGLRKKGARSIGYGASANGLRHRLQRTFVSWTATGAMIPQLSSARPDYMTFCLTPQARTTPGTVIMGQALKRNDTTNEYTIGAMNSLTTWDFNSFAANNNITPFNGLTIVGQPYSYHRSMIRSGILSLKPQDDSVKYVAVVTQYTPYDSV